MEKTTLLYIIAGVVLILTFMNTYSIFGMDQKLDSLNAKILLAKNDTSGSNSNDSGVKAADPKGNNQPEPVFNLSADDDPFLGPEDAKVTVIEFSDFECPYCAAAMGTHEGLIERFKSQDPSWEAAVPKLKELAEQGKIKFVYRDFPLNIHQNAQKAAEAAECAEEQNMFWEMHDKIFENSDSLSVENLKQFAKDIRLDSPEFDACLDSSEMASEVQKDLSDGSKAGITGTPAFFVNGRLVSGAQPFSVFEQIIEEELAKGGE